jgi:hypothetical protein
VLRIAGIAAFLVLAAPLVYGYAASFQIEPIVSQELVISIDDVETSSEGAPQERAEEPIGYVLGTNVVAIAPPVVQSGCGAGADCDEDDPGPEPVEPEAEEPVADEEPEPVAAPSQAAEYEAHAGFAWILPAQ